MWAISATVKDFTDYDLEVNQIPTFYLDENVQGIVNENHAESIAKDIINPTRNPLIQVIVTAVNVGSMCTETHVKPAPDKYLFTVRFEDFYAKYWTPENEYRIFQAIRYSNSGNSLWVWMDGQERCVPVECLLKPCPKCPTWVSTTQHHDCEPLDKWEWELLNSFK